MTNSRMLKLRAIGALAFASVMLAPNSVQSVRASEMQEIYAQAEWYRTRIEPEQISTGVLVENEPQVGPGARASLVYALETNTALIAIYAAGVERKLARYIGKAVRVRGKIIDLTKEGFSQELWIGSISLESKVDRSP